MVLFIEVFNNICKVNAMQISNCRPTIVKPEHCLLQKERSSLHTILSSFSPPLILTPLFPKTHLLVFLSASRSAKTPHARPSM